MSIHASTSPKPLLTVTLASTEAPGVVFSADDRAFAIANGGELHVYGLTQPFDIVLLTWQQKAWPG